MVKKDFNVSYQDVKFWIGNFLFSGVLWFILDKYFEQIINPKNYMVFIRTLNISSSFVLLLVVLIGYGIVYLIYGISQSLVTLAYWFFDSYPGINNIYPSLKEFDIEIPLTKNYYWKIKQNSKFALKYPGEQKTYFNKKKLDDWASRIIEKELDKIMGGK